MVKKTVKKKVTKLPRTIIPVKRLIGKSVKSKDRAIKALKPGRRISKTGRVYTETRRNRADLDGRKRL